MHAETTASAFTSALTLIDHSSIDLLHTSIFNDTVVERHCRRWNEPHNLAEHQPNSTKERSPFITILHQTLCRTEAKHFHSVYFLAVWNNARAV